METTLFLEARLFDEPAFYCYRVTIALDGLITPIFDKEPSKFRQTSTPEKLREVIAK